MSEINPYLSQSLAERVLGVKDRSRGSMILAHYALTGEITTPESFLAETQQLVGYIRESLKDAAYKVDIEKVEKGVASAILRQMFTESRIRGYNNVLFSWPVYQNLHERFIGQEAVDEDKNNILLIGSLTSLSSRAFKALASDVHRSNQAYIIDTTASDSKKCPGEFLYGDGLSIPFQNSSMRIAQTNLLIHMLRGLDGEVATEEAQEYAAMSRLFSEVFRVLQDGGHLLMREEATRLDYKDKAFISEYNQERVVAFQKLLFDSLSNAGFTDINMMPVWEPRHPDYLFDPSRSFKGYPMTLHPTSVGAYAKKPSA